MFSKKILLTVMLVIGTIGISSCSSKHHNNDDTIGPNITLGAPTEGSSYAKGKDIHIEFELDDESGIKEYKVDIHSAKGHTHTHKSLRADLTPWTYQKVYTDKREQKNAHVHVHSDVIPATVEPGDYHFGVLATDMLGNESEKYITIKITE